MDFELLVVGQGIAGTMMAHELDQMDVSYRVVDRGHQKACTAAAAGIMNPITGSRFTVAAEFSQLKEKALQSYGRLEEKLGVKLIYPLPIEKLFYDEEQKARWLKKREDPNFRAFLSKDLNGFKPVSAVYPYCVYGDVISESLAIDLKTLITAFREKLTKQNQLIEGDFKMEELINRETGFEWKGHQFEKIVFCQGVDLANNPVFKSSLLKPSKGQALIGKFSGELPKKIIKGKVFIAPYPSENFHWVGSWNQWQYSGSDAEDKGVEIILKKLSETIHMEFETIKAVAGIRPATKDRNPIIGSIPAYPGFYCFNGLGTKGTSLAPYWAEKLAGHIYYGLELPDSVKLSRF